MSCPHWVSRQCWAFVVTIFVGIFLIIALALPWYNIIQEDFYGIQYHNTTIGGRGNAAIVLYWNGAYVQYTPKDANGKNQDSEHETFNWDDFSNSSPKDVYLACMALTIIALILTLALGLSLLFCLMIHSFRQRLDESCHGWTKWFVFGLSLVVFLFVLVGWAAFFAMPNALEKANFLNCKAGSDKLWCDEFLGSKKFETGIGEADWLWGPSIGWIFSILATAAQIIVVVLALSVKGHSHYTLLGADAF